MLERTIKPYIEKASKGFPVLLLTGPRRVGKSVLLSMLSGEKRKYITLDNMDDRRMAQNDPAMFIQKYPPPVIIDEVQYAPELFTYIKIWVDSRKSEYLQGKKKSNPRGAFWLTGSQKYKLMKGIKESLAGRIAIIDLLGFSYKEIIKKPFDSKPFYPSMDMMHKEPSKKLKLMDVYKLIWNGSFPEVQTKKNLNRDEYFNSYIQTYIERDVKDFQGISNELKFLTFVRAVAVRTGNLVNYNSLANDCDIDLRTAQQWMNTLQRSGLVYLLPPYSPNITKRIIKTPKVYFLDTGLVSYLARIDSPQSLEASYLAGSILETYAFIEILKSFWHNGTEPLIYFYRDTNQKEIDFILEKNMTLYPVEVKKTTLPEESDIKSLGVLKHLKKKIGTAAIVCLNSNFLPLPKKDIISVPVWEI